MPKTEMSYMRKIEIKNVKISRRLVLILFIGGLLVSCSKDAETIDEPPVIPFTNFSLPNSEWHDANVVLAHIPGNELAHAQGRNKTFDIPAMQEEWTEYMNTLKRNNIQIFELTDVLMKMPINSLRDIAQKISSSDISNMNKEAIIKYMIETPPLKALYYTRDQSITTPRGMVIGSMTSAHRQLEPDLIELCYQYLGGRVYHRIHEDGAHLEGGDYFPFGTISIIGEGQRTNRKAILELMAADAFGHDTIVVVKDKLNNIYQMHLDTYFNIIDHNLTVLSQNRINAQSNENTFLYIDVFARAAGEKNYHLLHENSSFVDFLLQRNIKIIPVSSADQNKLATNFLCIGPRHIVARQGLSDDFTNKMKENGVNVEWVKLDELSEGDGAAHCMTQVIGRSK